MLLHRGVPDTVTQFGMTLPLPPSPSRSLCLLDSSGTPSSAASSSWCSLPQRHRVCCLAACCSAILSEKWKNRDENSAAEPGGSQWKRWLKERWMMVQADSIQLKSYHIALFFWNSSPKLVHPSIQKTEGRRGMWFLLLNQPRLKFSGITGTPEAKQIGHTLFSP